MKISCKIDDSYSPDTTLITVELQMETVTDKLVHDSATGVTVADVKKNGTLQFIMKVPKQPLPKPLQDRGKDDVRDSGI